jgi:hypothetical protein
MALTSPCGALVTLQFDAYLRGTQNVCVNFGANSTLNYVNITMDYGGNGDEIAGDMAFIVYHSTSLFGVQVGGHDYYIPTVMYAGPWPSTWQSSLMYQALLPVQGTSVFQAMMIETAVNKLQ